MFQFQFHVLVFIFLDRERLHCFIREKSKRSSPRLLIEPGV